jgi:hypothetical protein
MDRAARSRFNLRLLVLIADSLLWLLVLGPLIIQLALGSTCAVDSIEAGGPSHCLFGPLGDHIEGAIFFYEASVVFAFEILFPILLLTFALSILGHIQQYRFQQTSSVRLAISAPAVLVYLLLFLLVTARLRGLI